jgi:acyl dehydratase
MRGDSDDREVENMASSPLHGRGELFLDDLAVGQRFLSRTHMLTVDEIKTFATAYDPQPFHLDEAAAKDTFFAGLAASGWHTAALTMRLVVESVPLAGGVIGAGGELRWPNPTRPGDILQVESEVLELTPSRSRPDRGSAMMRIMTRNQSGQEVQTFTVKVILARRS